MSDEVGTTENGGAEDDWAAAFAEQEDAESGGGVEDTAAGAADNGADDMQRAEFENLEDDAAPQTVEDANLDVILDIPVTVSMEIGRTSINIRNLLQLNQGSVVELDRLAGEPMDVLVNGTLIAHGEVVVVNEKFGIRLTDVISAAERIKKLK